MNSKFKKGDQVTIINNDLIYIFYSVMFAKMGFKNTQYNPEPINTHGPWTVFTDPELHINGTDGWLVPIQNSVGKQCLIGEEGLRLVDAHIDEQTGSKQTTFVVTLLFQHRNGDFAMTSQKVLAADMAQAFGLVYEISKDEYEDMALTSKTVVKV